jgi:hypothetical protein
METTLPKKLEVNSVEKQIGLQEYRKHQQEVEDAKMFGVALTSLSKEELQVSLLMLRAALQMARFEMANVQRRADKLTSKLVSETDGVISAIKGSAVTKPNTYRPGDWVRINNRILDAYMEVWHDPGDVLQVMAIASDGEGLMFGSQLGIHYSDVEPAPTPK